VATCTSSSARPEAAASVVIFCKTTSTAPVCAPPHEPVPKQDDRAKDLSKGKEKTVFASHFTKYLPLTALFQKNKTILLSLSSAK
jgi:hypothetical protein